MRTINCSLVTAAGALAVALTLAPRATAECGGVPATLIRPADWSAQLGGLHLLRSALGSYDSDDQVEPVVGFWHVKFISDGVSSGIPGGIPKGAEVDAGYSQWHSDGTEILNSGGRAPDTTNFCLGVWEKVGYNKYLLNHFATSWDPTKGANGLVGPANIREFVTVAAGGQTFSGTFTINQYSEAGQLMVHLQGTIKGTRITPNTGPASIF